MRRGCLSRACSTWAVLAYSLGGDEAPGVDARRDAEDAPEVPVELALVVEADGLCSLGDEHAAPEQLPGAADTEVGQVLVGGQPDLAAERAHQVELVEPRVRGEIVEGDLVGERIMQEGARTAHGPRRPRRPP